MGHENRGAHGGDVYRNKIDHDFSINVNPLGMPEGVRRVLRESVDGWSRYPDPECGRLRSLLADRHQIDGRRIIFGNGAAEVIFRLVQAVRPRRALVTAPTFSEYEAALKTAGAGIEYCDLDRNDDFGVDVGRIIGYIEGLDAERIPDMIFLCNPNNPTGSAAERGEIEKLAKACHERNIYLVADECFCEFLDDPAAYSAVGLTERYPLLIVIRAFTKTYAMAGLRLGYGICGSEGLAEKIRLFMQPWSVSIPAQEAGCAALMEKGYLEKARKLVSSQRRALGGALEGMGFRVYRSQANYLLFEDLREKLMRGQQEENRRAGRPDLWEQLKDRGILIRDCSNYRGLGNGYYRICVGTEEENRILVTALESIMGKQH